MPRGTSWSKTIFKDLFSQSRDRGARTPSKVFLSNNNSSNNNAGMP